jgi:predicted RNA binding protein YcfA (HicA-like mRNA interferase family)
MTQVPPVKKAKFIKLLNLLGYNLIKIKGSHHKFNKTPSLTRPLILTLVEPIPGIYIRQNLKQIGLSEEDYVYFLENNNLPD